MSRKEFSVKMEILSVTNKKTQLHKSASDLSVKCINENGLKQAVSSDVSFFMSSLAPKAFVQVHKPNFLEVWRIKSSKDGKGGFKNEAQMLFFLKHLIPLQIPLIA